MVENIVACCGCVCNECPYYRRECGGCPKIREKPFWLEYTKEGQCGICQCYMEEKKLPHCGRCNELPYSWYGQQGLARMPREDAVGLKKILEVLRSLD